MEQWFKITLWMFILIGSLQANPIRLTANPCIEISGFKSSGTVTCGTNVTFTALKNIQETCYTAARGHFAEGLRQANQTCTDPDYETIHLLDIVTSLVTEPTTSPQTPCMTLKNGKTYTDFRRSLLSFLGRLNTHCTRG